MTKTSLAKRPVKSTKKNTGRQKDAFSNCNRVKLVHGGKDFFSLLKKLISKARHSIHLQTYIFDDDETGTSIAEELIAAAKRKVEVFILVDGYASQSVTKDFIRKLKDAGIHFRYFEPLLRSKLFYFGRRLHHKVIVIDAVKALVGSMNIADRYNDLPGKPAWLDRAIYVEGEASLELHWICCRFLSKSTPKAFQPPEEVKELIASIPKEECNLVSIRRNDWVNRQNQVYRAYMSMFQNAQRTISIVCSYFLPGRAMMKKLSGAVKRGVVVKVILAGVSDVKTAKYAERYLYRWLLRNKIEVYEYQRTVLHTKMAVVDKKVFTIGSYNLNELSAYASVELNLVIEDKELAADLVADIENIIDKHCKVIDLSTFDIQLFSFRQFLQWFAFHFLRILVRITTFYYRRNE